MTGLAAKDECDRFRARSWRILTAGSALVGLTLSACGDSHTVTPIANGGTLVISAFADADNLLPPLTLSGQGLQVVDAVFDRLGQPAVARDDGTTAAGAGLAQSWSWTGDSLAIDFALNPNARWHDGQAVTANDVRFTWQAYVDSAVASPAAQGLRNIDSVTVVSASVARVWFKQRNSEQWNDAALQMRILPQHLLDTVPRASWKTAAFGRHPIGSGRFRFGSWQAGSRLELIADTANYRGRPRLDRVIWTVSPDPAAATMRLFSGDADFLESVRPDAATEFAKHPDVMLLKSPSLAYGFVQFNLERANGTPHPILGDRAMRRALSMAVDRSLLVQAVFDSMARVALGPLTRVQLAGDSALPQLAYDTMAAAHVLDSLGWKPTKAGELRARNGQPLAITVLVPSSSSTRVRLATLLQEQLARVGVRVTLEQVEFNAFNARLGKGDFDAAVNAMGIDPSPGAIRGIWSSGAGRAQGGANFGNYRSARFDALLDSASMQRQATAATPYYRRAYEEILSDAPAIWLFEPWNLSGVRRDVHPIGIRPDGWWMQLGDWSRDAKK